MFDVNMVRERLKSFGYEAKEEDRFSMGFCMDKVQNLIKNKTHLNVVPKGLEQAAVDMVVGEFLLAKKTFAPDSLSDLDLSVAVKQIQAGDTNTVFATGEGSLTAEQRLDAFIGTLLARESEILHYRRLKW